LITTPHFFPFLRSDHNMSVLEATEIYELNGMMSAKHEWTDGH
jgi:hypothetical protein